MFDTGNPLEGYGAELPEPHERLRRGPQSRGRGRDASPSGAKQAGRATSTERGGVDAHRHLTRTQDNHELDMRPISPADETALIAFHDRCSEETRYLRFASAKPQLRTAEARYLCAVDDRSRGALVVVESDDADSIHGVGRWERIAPAEAELAFVVEDAYQGQGIGSKLVEATIERAHRAGFKRLVVDVLLSNYRMRHLAGDYGLDIADL